MIKIVIPIVVRVMGGAAPAVPVRITGTARVIAVAIVIVIVRLLGGAPVSSSGANDRNNKSDSHSDHNSSTIKGRSGASK